MDPLGRTAEFQASEAEAANSNRNPKLCQIPNPNYSYINVKSVVIRIMITLITFIIVSITVVIVTIVNHYIAI